jgi:hypothetical protein
MGEPKFKVGDVVVAGGPPFVIAEVVRLPMGYFYRSEAGSPRTGRGEISLTLVTPAPDPAVLDPALHEVARETIAALRELLADGPIPARPLGMQDLPGYAEWRDDPKASEANARWAAQLERLLPAPDPVRDEARRLWEKLAPTVAMDPRFAIGRVGAHPRALAHAYFKYGVYEHGLTLMGKVPYCKPDSQPETWHDRLVRLAREAEAAREAQHAAAMVRLGAQDALIEASEAEDRADEAVREAEEAFSFATQASAILSAGGGK